MRDDGVVAAAIRAARYADAVMRRTATGGDPFDPRQFGASRTAGYGGEWHEELYDENGDYIGPPWPQDMAHHLHSDPVQAPYNAGYHAAWHPAFRDEKDRLGVAESAWHAAGGSPNSSDSSQDFASFEDGWMDSLNEIPHKFLDPQAHQAHLEGQLDEQKLWKERQHEKAIEKHFNPYPGWNPDEHQDPFDPRLIGAGKRTARDVPEGEDWEDWERRLERHMRDNPELYEAANYPFDELGSYNGTRWPEDLSHHLHADPGIASYNAGYAAYQHPAFADHDSPLHAAKEAWYQAGGRDLNPQNGTSFEDGYLDAEGEIPHRFRDAEGYEGWLAERGEEMPNPVGDAYADWNPDDKQDPFDPRLLGASRRTAGEDVVLPHDEPHDDWRPRYGDNPKVQKWHPYVGGDTHAKYHIYSLGGGRNSVVWGANHHGIYQGMERVYSPLDGDHGSITMPSYSTEHEPEQLGRFRTPEQAKAAAEKHFADTYGRHQKMDGLNLDQMMRDHGDRPRAETGLGEDEDYGHIFGMLRQAGWEMADMIRLAGDGMSWEDTMAHIDRVLAEGEPGTDEGRLPETESLLYEDYRNGPIPEQVQHEVGQCRNCGKSVIKQLGTGRWLDLWHFSSVCGTAGTTENPRGRLLLHEADIIRLAGDGMSWEDTMNYIDQTLAEGQPEDTSDYSTDYYEEPLPPGAEALQCNHCKGYARNAYEVNHVSVGDDYKGTFCNNCLRDLMPSWYGHTARLAGLDMADIVRLAGDGMSYEDAMRYIDETLAEGEQTPVRKMRTAPEGFRPQPPQFPDDGEFDYLSDEAEAQRIRDWDDQRDG